MASNNNSVLLGVFPDSARAMQAINELQRAGVSNNQIRYSLRGTTPTGIQHNLIDVGIPENDARFYQKEFESGHTIVMVKSAGSEQPIRDILHRFGAYDASSRAENANVLQTEGEQTLQLREEVLQPHKQQVQAGEVRIGKELVTEQRTMNVPVAREEILVERLPVDNRPSDMPIGSDEIFRIPVMVEQVLLGKQPVVREELAVRKQVVQEEQQVSATVLREKARIERDGDVNISSNLENI